MGDAPVKYIPASEGAFRQGEIVSDLALHIPSSLTAGGRKQDFTRIQIPIAIILSQDCDLDWDFKARSPGNANEGKLLHSILFCQAENAAAAKARIRNSEAWKRIIQNKDERYQFLQTVPADQDAAGLGIGEMVLDFKRYFALVVEDAYQQTATLAKRRTRLNDPYLQHLTTRFFYFQYRVALPLDHESEPVAP